MNILLALLGLIMIALGLWLITPPLLLVAGGMGILRLWYVTDAERSKG
jgi:hypothetical protein